MNMYSPIIFCDISLCDPIPSPHRCLEPRMKIIGRLLDILQPFNSSMQKLLCTSQPGHKTEILNYSSYCYMTEWPTHRQTERFGKFYRHHKLVSVSMCLCHNSEFKHDWSFLFSVLDYITSIINTQTKATVILNHFWVWSYILFLGNFLPLMNWLM